MAPVNVWAAFLENIQIHQGLCIVKNALVAIFRAMEGPCALPALLGPTHRLLGQVCVSCVSVVLFRLGRPWSVKETARFVMLASFRAEVDSHNVLFAQKVGTPAVLDL